MEKHKPYRCDACGKRYKNLNGLKYHKNHSAACEDLKSDAMDPSSIKFCQPGFGSNAPAGMTNGLAGIDEDMVM